MSQFSNLDDFKAIREKWVHEDNVINHRLTWLILSQAMLMAAYGWSIGSTGSAAMKTQKLLIVIPFFGILFAVAIGLSVIAAVIAQNSLRQHLGADKWPAPYNIDTLTTLNWPGRIAAISLPIFLFILWLLVLVA